MANSYYLGQLLGVVNHLVDDAFTEVGTAEDATLLSIGIDLLEQLLALSVVTRHLVWEAHQQSAPPPLLGGGHLAVVLVIAPSGAALLDNRFHTFGYKGMTIQLCGRLWKHRLSGLHASAVHTRA